MTHLISVLYVLPVENVPPVRHRVLSLVSFWILPSAFPRVHHLDCRLSRRPDVVHFAVICTRCRTKYGALSLRDDALIALWHPSSWMLFVLGHRLRDWRGRKKCGEIFLPVKTRRWPIASRSVSQLVSCATNQSYRGSASFHQDSRPIASADAMRSNSIAIRTHIRPSVGALITPTSTAAGPASAAVRHARRFWRGVTLPMFVSRNYFTHISTRSAVAWVEWV